MGIRNLRLLLPYDVDVKPPPTPPDEEQPVDEISTDINDSI